MAAGALPPPLLALSPGDLAPQATAGFLAHARAALRAGLPGLLLRESRLTDREYLELALRLRDEVAATADGWLCVHDRAHLAESAGAHAVHVGFRSLAPAELRPWLAPRLAIGLSTHARDESRGWSAADYLFHGPVFDTPSKREWLEPIGAAGLARAVASTDRPVWALGGLRPEHAAPMRRAGARGVAVRASIFGAPDVRAAAVAWRTAVDAAFEATR